MKNPYFNAALASAYIVGVINLISFGEKLTKISDDSGLIIPVAMLSLLVFSVALMGFLFFAGPIRVFLEGNAKEAFMLFAKTLAIFGLLTLAVFGSLVLIEMTV